jgi:hypothetical protein
MDKRWDRITAVSLRVLQWNAHIEMVVPDYQIFRVVRGGQCLMKWRRCEGGFLGAGVMTSQ